ncbi:MAG: hydroxymyristoyl-ACP dehydratase [Candidatus Cryptobacteroides sp.]
MTEKKRFLGDEILSLIPQRKPMTMIDSIFCPTESEAETGLRIQGDNLFCEGGKFREPGIIEHQAQSAAALMGFISGAEDGRKPDLGYIGEIKKLKIRRLPLVGDTLTTKISVLGEAEGVTLVTAATAAIPNGHEESDRYAVAECRMKLFLDRKQGNGSK